MAKKTTNDTEINIKYPTNVWDFLNNLVGIASEIILLILCTPFGWAGMIFFGFVFLWITTGVKP